MYFKGDQLLIGIYSSIQQGHDSLALKHPSLLHSSRSFQHSKTVLFPKQLSHSSLYFLVDQVLASQIKTEEETLWMTLTPLWISNQSPSLVHSSRSIQHSKTVQFPKQLSHTSLCFLVDQVLVSQIKTEKETLWVTPTPLQVSSQSHHLLCTVQDLSSATRQSSLPKQLSHTSLCFLVDQVLAPEIKTEKETLWVMPTPLWVSNQLPISCAQFMICSTQYVSPDSKTTFTHFSLFFGGPSLSITDQD